MKRFGYFFLVVLVFFLSACKPAAPACPPDSITYQDPAVPFPTLAPADRPASSAPTSVEIGGKTLEVDQVIHGQLCNLSLRGTVYVACDVQIKEWKERPDFLTGCDFNVEPDTVIYVAAHNDSPYYNGCASCHAR